MLRNHDGTGFDVAWPSPAEERLPHVYTASLRRDIAAGRAAVDLLWSKGQVEGQVNRLKRKNCF